MLTLSQPYSTLGGLICWPRLSASPHRLNPEDLRAYGNAFCPGCLKSGAKQVGSVWRISRSRDADVSFSLGETGSSRQVPKAALTVCSVNTPPTTRPLEWGSAQPLSDQATAPSPVGSPPNVAPPISPPEAPPSPPSWPSRLGRGGAADHLESGLTSRLDYKSQQSLDSAHRGRG